MREELDFGTDSADRTDTTDSTDDGRDILDVGNVRRRFEWRPPSRRELLVFVLVAVLGLGVSGGLTLWLDARENERALASEAHLTGYLLPAHEESAIDENLCTRLDLRLVNAGRRPVTIESIGLDLARLHMEPTCGPPPKPPPPAIAPLDSATWTVPVRIDCGRMSGRQEIVATVRTQSGAVQRVSMPAGGYLYELANCDQPFVDWNAAKAERISTYGKPALRLTGTFRVDIRWLDLEAAGTAGFGAAVEVLGSSLPKRIGPKPAQGQLDIAIDCDAMPDIENANFEVNLQTNLSVQTTIQPDSGPPHVAAAMIRLVVDTCEEAL